MEDRHHVSKSSAMLFVKTGRRIPKSRAVHLFGESMERVDDTCYLVVTFEKRLTWSKHIDQVRKKTAHRLGMLGPLLNRRSGLSVRNDVLLYKQLICPMLGLRVSRLEVRCPLPYQETASTAVQVSSHCYQCTLVHW